MFLGVKQQINGGIDEWPWVPNETLHDAALGLFQSGSQQLPSLAKKNHNTACDCIAVAAGDTDELSAQRSSSPLLLFVSPLFCFLYIAICIPGTHFLIKYAPPTLLW